MRFSAIAAIALVISSATPALAQDAPSPAPATEAAPEGDIVVTATMASPLTNPESWLTAWDFPKIAMDNHHEGTVEYRLTVGAQGAVTACTIVQSSGFAELDQTTCQVLIQRARFRAGGGETWFAGQKSWIVPLGVVDANRDMVMERMTQQMRAPRPRMEPVTWVNSTDYPAEARRDGIQGGVEYWLEVGTDGKVTRCAAKGANAGAQALEGETCRLLTARAAFWPALDRDGTPMLGVYSDLIYWSLAPTPVKAVGAADMVLTMSAVPVGWLSPIVLKADILVEADGTIEDCRFQSIVAGTHDPASAERAVSLIPLGESGCRSVVGGRASRPLAGEDGRAVRSMQTLTFRFARPAG